MLVSFGDFASDLVVVYSFYDEGKTFLLLSSALFILMVAMYTVVLLWTNGRRGSALLQVRCAARHVDVWASALTMSSGLRESAFHTFICFCRVSNCLRAST